MEEKRRGRISWSAYQHSLPTACDLVRENLTLLHSVRKDFSSFSCPTGGLFDGSTESG